MVLRELAAIPALLLLVACNQYDMFRVSGYQQESFTNDADILFVIDNSGSMSEESGALALNFGVFMDRLTAEGSGSATADGLVDAVDNYIEFSARRGTFIDYRMGITSTDVEAEYGGLFGDPSVLAFGDTGVEDAFLTSLLCEAAFFDTNTPVDPGYVCGDEPQFLSEQYLDCMCPGGRATAPGTGNEEPLEAIFMALCRSVEDPPSACFGDENQFTDADILSNDGLLRDDAAFIAVVVTDEGDNSRRMAQGEPDPEVYDALYRSFDRRLSFAFIGPEAGVCNGTTPVPNWGVDRFEWLAEKYNGLYVPITQGEPDCAMTDFADALEQLGDLMNKLSTVFPLQAVPDPETILVFIDDEPVPRSLETDDGQGGVEYDDGWSYDPEVNAVVFHGDWVPDYSAKVRIYYQPLSGMPRDLPF